MLLLFVIVLVEEEEEKRPEWSDFLKRTRWHFFIPERHFW